MVDGLDGRDDEAVGIGGAEVRGVTSWRTATGLRAEADLRGGSVKSQFRRADKAKAGAALILGPAEVERGVVQIKDLRTSEQK